MPTSERSTDDLRAYLEALTEAVDAGAESRRPAHVPRRRRTAVLVGAAAAVVVMAFAVVTFVSDDNDRRSVDAVDQPDGEDPADHEPGAPVPGAWRPLDDLVPVADSYTAAFWTGSELLAVYPENEGDDVTIQLWDESLENPRTASPSGLSWRASATIVWTGTEVLILGGSNGPGIERPAVAYDPETDEWRDLTPSAGFVAGRSENVVQDGQWTGSEVVFVGQGMAYRPDSDSWRDLPTPPSGAVRPGGAIVATDRHVVVWGGCPDDVTNDICESERLATGGGAVLDLNEQTWHELPTGGPVPGAEIRGVWTGSEVVLVSTRTGRDEPTGTVAAYDLASQTWRDLPDPPFETTFRTRLVTTPASSAMPAGVVLVGEGMPASTLDVDSGEWRRLGADPFTSGSAAAWAGDRLAVIGNSYVFEPDSGNPPEDPPATTTKTTGCDAATETDPVVGMRTVTYLPDGFTPDGPVQEQDTGNVDQGGESERRQRFSDPNGRWLEVVDFGSYDPRGYIEAAAAATLEPVTVLGCWPSEEGQREGEVTALVAEGPDGIVAGAQEWEYGGYMVVGGPEISRGEVLAVMSGLHRQP